MASPSLKFWLRHWSLEATEDPPDLEPSDINQCEVVQVAIAQEHCVNYVALKQEEEKE